MSFDGYGAPGVAVVSLVPSPCTHSNRLGVISSRTCCPSSVTCRVSGCASVKKIVSKLISVLSAGWLCDRSEGSGIRRNAFSTIPSVTCGGAAAAAAAGGPLPEQTSPIGVAGGGVDLPEPIDLLAGRAVFCGTGGLVVVQTGRHTGCATR